MLVVVLVVAVVVVSCLLWSCGRQASRLVLLLLGFHGFMVFIELLAKKLGVLEGPP